MCLIISRSETKAEHSTSIYPIVDYSEAQHNKHNTQHNTTHNIKGDLTGLIFGDLFRQRSTEILEMFKIPATI